jgi:hypothetical protein
VFHDKSNRIGGFLIQAVQVFATLFYPISLNLGQLNHYGANFADILVIPPLSSRSLRDHLTSGPDFSYLV